MSNFSKRASAITEHDNFISLEALEYLGYGTEDGIYTEYEGYEGELMPVWGLDNGVAAPFCCLYVPEREVALIIPMPFEIAASRLEYE